MQGRELLARNLRRIRVACGVSQERLAADAGIDRAYVSEIEREQANVTLDLLDRMAAVLGCEVGEFLRMPEDGEEVSAGLKRGRRPTVG
jgi:transcriptional regulator with XRE-family HTH domain